VESSSERHNDYDAFAQGYAQDSDNDATNAAGFTLDVVSQPQPDPAAENLFPSAYADLRTNPRFLFFRLIAP
jgi:hypothetical protein